MEMREALWLNGAFFIPAWVMGILSHTEQKEYLNRVKENMIVKYDIVFNGWVFIFK